MIIAEARTPEDVKALDENLALLALYAFGSAYKAEVEDIASMQPAPLWEAPPALEVTAEELSTWLLGPRPRPSCRSRAASRHVAGAADRKEIGTYQTVKSGLVVAILPAGASNNLNDHVDELRRFMVDTDVFLAAVKLEKSNRVALIGRERTTSFAAMPPLRVETICFWPPSAPTNSSRVTSARGRLQESS